MKNKFKEFGCEFKNEAECEEDFDEIDEDFKESEQEYFEDD